MGRIIAMDFDGVIHSYKSGWLGEDKIQDLPVNGAKKAIDLYIKNGFEIHIFSSRCSSDKGRLAICNWLYNNGFNPDIVVSAIKPPAYMSIDDRSFPPWDGVFPTIDQIENFKPWWMK